MTDARGRSARITSLVVLGGLIVGGLVLDAADGDDSISAVAPVVAGVAMPAARPDPSLASTWYCAAGTSDGGGFGDHVVIIANPSERARTATITALTGSIAPAPTGAGATGDEGGGATTSTTKATTTTKASTTTTSSSTTTAAEAPAPTKVLDLPARSRVVFRMADLVKAPLVSAVVEVGGGQVSVEHELTGSLGKATAPCSTTVSPTWSFPWGVTTRGNRELLVFMNPFPDDATVDVSFATDEGVRDTVRFSGFVVPGRSVVGAYVDEDVTRKEQVSAQVTVRGGRLVVDRVALMSGVADGREGFTVGLGAPQAADGWIFPDGLKGDGIEEQVVVYNPGDRVAEVQVEVRLDQPEVNEVPEPFDLTVPPQRYAIVSLDKEDRIVSDVGHSLIVRTLNDVPMIAERVVAAKEGAKRRGVSATLGAPLGAPTWYFPGGGVTAERDEFITVFNVSETETVTYSVSALAGGQSLAIADLQGLQIAPGGRASLRLSDHVQREDLPVVVTADGPIVAERGLYRVGGDGLSQAIGIPLAEGTEAPARITGD